jgi:predicted ribonuclease YlaK
LGILPGEVNDKFLPYLQGYMCNLEFLLGDKENKTQNIQDLVDILATGTKLKVRVVMATQFTK